MASTQQEQNLNEAADKLNKHLKERQNPNPKTESIFRQSKEKAELERNNSADANALSRSKKEQKLDAFLKSNRNRKRRRRKITFSDVRSDTAKILEEFLQSQLQGQAIQTKSPEKYQRYVEVDVTTETTPSGSSTGYLASESNYQRTDSIPYADESDKELRKAESLPHDDFLELAQGTEIHHGKSKSAPYQQNEEEDDKRYTDYRNPKRTVPPPPPPPGTPHTPSEEGSEGQYHAVPYAGKHTDSSIPYSTDSLNHSPSHSPPKRRTPPKAPDTLDIQTHGHKHKAPDTLDIQTHGHKHKAPNTLDIPTHGHTHKAADTLDMHVHVPTHDYNHHSLSKPGEIRQGSSSRSSKSSSPSKSHSLGFMKHKKSAHSSGTDSEGGSDPYLHGRKKKSLFRKTQERFQTLLRIKKPQSSMDDEYQDRINTRQDVSRKKTRSKKKHKSKKDKNMVDMDEADTYEPHVPEERHIHHDKHIHQTHIEGGRGVLREEDSTDVIDVVSDSEKKHTRTQRKVKESSENGEGILGKLRRMTSRNKEKKTSMQGSKSLHWESERGASGADNGPNYSRAESVPGHHRHHATGYDFHDDAGTNLTMDGSGGYSVRSVERTRTTGSREDIRVTEPPKKLIKVVSRVDDIRRHSSHLDIVDHSGNTINRLYFDAEDYGNLPRNESFDFDQRSSIHETTYTDADGHVRVKRDITTHSHLETSGRDMEIDEDTVAKPPLSEAEKEDMYGKIAERLIEIGDSFNSERQQEQTRRSSSHSPRGKLSQDSGEKDIIAEEEMQKTVLTQLEMEIRDELRQVAADIDARLAASARNAAMKIAGLATYHHFKNVASETVGNEIGWAQVAAVFNITKRAVQMVGSGGALAVQIKEMSLRYIEDTFANWIVGQGGWDSMLSESESDSGSDLD